MDIYLDQPSIGKLELDYVSRATREGEISTRSKYVPLFEEKLAAYLGIDPSAVIATNSGTTALTVCAWLLYQKGSTITVPALTFVATANALKRANCRIRVADVNKDDWVLHMADDAVLPVDLYGVPSQSDNCTLVDSCEAFGILHQHTCVYSFNHNKTITCGGGGAIIGIPPWGMSVIRCVISQGVRGEHRPFPGFNGRMTGLHASLGLAQIERASELLEGKIAIKHLYQQELDDIVTFQTGPSNRWMTACTTTVPAAIMQYELLKVNIPSRRVFTPIHFLISSPTVCPNAESIYHYGICLPSSTLNTDDAILHVCSNVRRIIEEYKP